MRQFLLCLVLLALGLFTPQSTSAFLLHGGGSPGLPYHGPCDDISGGCAETWNFQRAAANSYSGALFRLTNTSNSATLDIVQDGSRKADMTTWSAFCGGTNTTTNGISVNSVCVISKVYAQIHGSANDLVPAVFNAPFGPDCSTGGALVCACPFAVEVATGLPILKSTPPCEYTIASDANATGITAGTSSLSLFYEGIAQAATYCCGPAGIGHAWNAADDFGTTFYLSVAQGQFSFSSGNECQTSTSYCSGLDEESIGDLVDYSPTNIGSVFAAGAFNAGTNTVSSYINGGQVRSPITPAAGLCTGCTGINLPQSVHIGGGGDLSQPALAVSRGFGFTNGVIGQSDVNAAYSNIKTFYSGLLTFTDYAAPTTAVTVIQSAVAQNGSGGATTKTLTLGSPTGTGKRGVLVGLFWCKSAGGCGGGTTTDVFAAGTVTLGSNTCTEVPNSFASVTFSGGFSFQTEVWACANLTNATSNIVATTDGTSVSFLGVLGNEINCPTSGCVVDQGGSGSAATSASWYCNATTNANTTATGDFLYSIVASGVNVNARGTALNTSITTLRDEYVATGPSGQKYTASWVQTGLGGSSGAQCSAAAIKP